MNNNKSAPWFLWVGLIAIVVMVIFAIRFIIGGTIAFFQTKGIGKWLLVALALALFVILVMSADRKS